MQDAEEEEITTIYKQIKPHYIRYKLTGDITQLSGKVELEEGTLPSSHPSTQLVSDNARQVEWFWCYFKFDIADKGRIVWMLDK